ncbi:hypothetical protein FQV21_0007896, partial [Spheniscus demersus]
CPQGPEECWDPEAGAEPAPNGSMEPGVPDGDEQEEPDAEAEPGPCPDTPKAGPPMEEGSCTSSDDDVEGLRRRQGHEPRPRPPAPAPAPRWGMPDAGAEDGLSMSKYLLGALVLVAVGLLIISGEWGSQGQGKGPCVPLIVPSSPQVASTTRRMVSTGHCPARAGCSSAAAWMYGHSQTSPSGSSPGPVGTVLSRDVAAGEQESPLPADGNAHKEELHALLQKSEGEAAAAGVQQQSLAAENARLRAALEREATALRNARAEVQRLRAAGALGSPGAGEPAAEQPPGTGAAACGEDAVRREGTR